MSNHGHYRILQVVQCCRMEKARVGWQARKLEGSMVMSQRVAQAQLRTGLFPEGSEEQLKCSNQGLVSSGFTL